MSDLMRALAISGSILIGVVLFIVVISFVAVRRGEIEMSEAARHGRAARH